MNDLKYQYELFITKADIEIVENSNSKFLPQIVSKVLMPKLNDGATWIH